MIESFDYVGNFVAK